MLRATGVTTVFGNPGSTDAFARFLAAQRIGLEPVIRGGGMRAE